MESKLHNQKGEEIGKVDLPEAVFGLPWNADLVHQVAVSYMANARAPIAHTKDRSEVSGGGRKPWKQKGTGRARHGSRRSPIWRTGGVTFGPTKERNFSKKINKKMKTKAFHTALSQKLLNNEILFVDMLDTKDAKTKQAKDILNSLSSAQGFKTLSTKKRNAAYISLAEQNPAVLKSFNNFGNIEVGEFRNMNILDILQYKYLIITNPKESIKNLEK